MTRVCLVLAALLFAALGVVVNPEPAYACSCAGISTSRAVLNADAVFRGHVVAKDSVGRGDEQRVDLRFEVDAVYKGTETVDGLRTYRYDVHVPNTAAEVVDGVQGNYTTDKSIWVEPRTGSIVKQTQHEVRTLANGDPLLDLDIAYTDQSVKEAVDEADGNARSLWLLTSVVPIGGLVVGLLLVLAGLGLLLRGGVPRRVRP